MVQLCYTIWGLCVMACAENKYGDKANRVTQISYLMSTEIDLCASMCGHKGNFGALWLIYSIIESVNGQFFTS